MSVYIKGKNGEKIKVAGLGGVRGEPGKGIPEGGKSGQLLVKSSSSDYDAKWGSEGYATHATGDYSHAEGYDTEARGEASHVEGEATNAYGDYSHAEGAGSNAYGEASHVEGGFSVANGNISHAEGMFCGALGMCSHASGQYTTAHGCEYVIGISNVNSKGSDSEPTENRFIVGNGSVGSSNVSSNVFRITDTGIYGSAEFTGTGADYAEMFEWSDGNADSEDRVGRFVTLDGEKISLANSSNDFVLGIVSASPTIIGDVYNDQWRGMYLEDVFGRPIWESVEAKQVAMPNGKVIMPSHTQRRRKINPDYRQDEQYIGRSQRKEWSAIGMLGKLIAIDDGTCEINGWCKPTAGGIATKSDERTKYRVIARIDKTHIRVLIL